MKHSILLFLTCYFVLIINDNYAQGDLQWLMHISNVTDDIDIHSMTTDANGNIYIGGSYDDQPAPQVQFDGVTQTTTHEQMGYIAKYDANKVQQWMIKFGSPNSTTGFSPLAMVTDANYLYVAGSFEYASSPGVDFDPGPGTNYHQSTSSSAADFFVGKYNLTDGSMVWAYSGGVSGGGADIPYGIDIDASGNIYLFGKVEAGGTAVDFDIKNKTGVYGLTNQIHLYVAKYDNNGNLLWRRNISNSSDVPSEAGDIVVDNSNNCFYIASGIGENSSGLDPVFSGTTLNVNPTKDGFVAKYDLNGNLLWVKNIVRGTATTYTSYIEDIDIDASGNFYIIGSFNNTADFDPSASTSTLTAAGGYDIFIAKYNSSGTLLWKYKIGGTNSDYGYGISVNSIGRLAICGMINGTVDCNPEGTGGAQNKGSAGYNIFIGEYDSNFQFQWAHGINGGSGWISEARKVAVDKQNSPYPIYIFGYLDNGAINADFDPNNPGGTYSGSGTRDNGYLAKYSSNIALPIELIRFNAKNLPTKVKLEWETSQEINNDYFIIERSIDMKNWEAIAKVKGKGITFTPSDYSTTDENPYSGTSYYRLIQVDYNGTTSTSSLLSIYRSKKAKIRMSFYNNYLYVNNINTPTNIFIYNMNAQLVKHYIAQKENTELSLHDLPAGNYTITVISGNGTVLASSKISKWE